MSVVRSRCGASRLACLLLAALAVGGCERGMHDMYQQPKYKPLAPSPLFANGHSARHPPPGTEPTSGGAEADTSSGRCGTLAAAASVGPASPLDDMGQPLAHAGAGGSSHANPLPVTMTLLKRGRQRFDVYCAPCHGRAGDGDGMIVRRGFPAPPSYHTATLRNAPDSHFYRVITHGYGVMYPYGDRIAPRDRWAIVAWIRALQLSQHAPLDRLAPRDLKQLALLQPAHAASTEQQP